jgi:hypothetical protein
MENLSEIKWCAQKLCELIKSGQGNEILGDVYRVVDAHILHGTVFQNVEKKPPVIEDES